MDMIMNCEYIISAAVYRKQPNMPEESRVMYKDPSKWDEFGKIDDIYFIETARRHPEILHRWRDSLCRDKQGFYTSHGRFVDRKTALQIALKSGQVEPGEVSGELLFSEDLW